MYLTAVLLATLGLPTVAIDLPADTPSQTVARVVDSCNAALGARRCEALRPTGNDTTLLAVVRFQGAALEIRLFRGEGVRTEVERRSVAFSEDDAAPDRYIAAGLMVAALTAAQPEAPPEPPPEPSAAPPEPPPAVSTPPSESLPERREASGPHLGFDLGFQMGQGLDSRNPKLGGVFQSWWLAESPRLGASVSLAYLYAGQPVELTWACVGLGLTGRVTDWTAPVSVEVSTEALLQKATAAAERAGIRRSEDVLRWGGRLSSKLAFPLGGPIQPWLGWEVTLLRPSFEVRLEDEHLGTEGPLRFGLALGIRVVPFTNQGFGPEK
jgi:hypothetical protein